MDTRPSDALIELAARQSGFAKLARSCTNLGETGDTSDLYAVIDAMIDDLTANLPPFACGAGCNQCCYTLPVASSFEWRTLYPVILALPLTARGQILSMAERLRPLANDIASMRASVQGAPQPTSPELAVQCPFLLEGRCSVYTGRPLKCRAYGYGIIHVDGEGKFYGSHLARQHVAARFPPGGMPLPNLDPYFETERTLNAAIGGTHATLPEWLWAHMGGGALVPDLRLDPGLPD